MYLSLFLYLLVGFREETNGYRVWIPDEKKIKISRDIVFREHSVKQTVSVTNQQTNYSESYVIFGPDVLDINEERVTRSTDVSVKNGLTSSCS